MILVLLAAVPLAAEAPRPGGVATENVSPNGLTISPRIAYERATLRISGPQGFAGRRSFAAGEPIQVDLTSFDRRAKNGRSQRATGPMHLSSRSDTPDGRYKFEVVFSVAGRKVGVHTGMFFVERGSAVSRQAKRAQLASLRGDLDRSRQQIAASGRRGHPTSATPTHPRAAG
jgi:hypothetical protein